MITSLKHALRWRAGAALLCLASLLLPGMASAQALVSPTRLLLSEAGQTANFILRNPSDGPRTYRLEWIEQTQGRHGVGNRVAEGSTPPHPVASPYLRVTPRQVTVDGNSNQTVRVSFRPDPAMAPGEYRSHLLFRVVPEVSTPVSSETISGEDGKISMKVDMQMSISVPVVVRHQLNALPQASIVSVTPRPASGNEQNAQLVVVLRQQGQASSFGRVTVDLQSGANAAVERIGQADSVSIFPDVGEREVLVMLRDRDFPPGALLRVAYEGTAEYQGQLWAEQVLQIR